MINKIVSTGVVISTMFMVIGCGAVDDLVDKYVDEDDDEIVFTGKSYYIDSAVSGVNYTCGSQEGITGADGSFTFEYGSGCTFYLGDMELRGVDSNLLVDGNNVYETDVNIARILQSLDSDGDASNGIMVDAEIIEAIAQAGITTLPDTVEELAALEEVLIANDLTLVSIDDAQDHLNETVIQLLLAGNTFYAVGQDVNDTTDIWGGAATFNADLTEITFIEAYTANGETEIMSISIDGDRLIFGDDSDGSYTTIGENKGDYIEVTDHYSDGTIERNIRFYFDQARADAYVSELQYQITINGFTLEILEGKTFYAINEDGDFADVEILSFISSSEINFIELRGTSGVDGIIVSESSNVTLPYRIEGGVLIIDNSTPGDPSQITYELISITDTQWNVIKDGYTDIPYNTWLIEKPDRLTIQSDL